MLRVGVVGYSGGKFDKNRAKILVDAALQTLYNREKGDIEIVSGLTDIGIPALAYDFAARNKLRTVGVACQKATDYDCFPVDEKIIVGKDWGDESETFLKNIDFLVRVGGGDQSMAEVAKFRANRGGANIMELELERLN